MSLGPFFRIYFFFDFGSNVMGIATTLYVYANKTDFSVIKLGFVEH